MRRRQAMERRRPRRAGRSARSEFGPGMPWPASPVRLHDPRTRLAPPVVAPDFSSRRIGDFLDLALGQFAALSTLGQRLPIPRRPGRDSRKAWRIGLDDTTCDRALPRPVATGSAPTPRALSPFLDLILLPRTRAPNSKFSWAHTAT